MSFLTKFLESVDGSGVQKDSFRDKFGFFLRKIWLFYLSFGGMHYKPLAINGNEGHRVGRKKDGDGW